MPRVKVFLDNLALALYQKARKPLNGTGRWVDSTPDVARVAWEAMQRELAPGEIEMAIGELVRLTDSQYAVRVIATLDHLRELHPIPFREALESYFIIIPTLLRAYFQRPSDITGVNPPKKWRLKDHHDLHELLPARAPELGPGREPKGLDNWQLAELIGFGELTETWRAVDSTHPDQMATLKFITDHEAADAVRTQQDCFLEAFRLVHDVGIVPLRQVYLQTDPPALDMPYLSGYNLANLIRDWQWKFDSAKPDAANKLVKRIAELVAKAHEKGVIHRDLKPSNVLLHPTEGDKFTLWIANFGWSLLASARSGILARGGTPRPEVQRLARLGAHGSLYSSPQQMRKDAPDPRDDVYAIGVIWYQLLMRDPHASPPVDRDWAEAMPSLSPLHVELLMTCIATRPDKRPENASELAAQLKELAEEHDTAKSFPLKGQSGEYPKLILSNDPSKSSATRAKDTLPPSAASGHAGMPRFLTNSLGMTFALIPPGEFTMGSDASESGRHDDEDPPHTVRITRPFYMGVFLITQSQYQKVMGNNPSLFTKANGGGMDHPVDSVRWNDVEKFCARMNEVPEEEARNRQYRMPTEAEWEYACRAGTTTPFSSGMTATNRHAHYATGGAFGKAGGVARTLPVGSLAPNPYGLYDMHGNLQEWVSDWYNEYYYQDSPTDDPQGPTYGLEKVVRGGCYRMFGSDCRSAARKSFPPNTVSPTVGFRVVLIV